MDSEKTQRTHAKSMLLLFLGALTSSFIAPVSRLSEGLHPVALLCLASTIAFLAHCAFFGTKLPLHLLKKTRATVIAFLGGVVLTWSYILFAWSIRETSNEIIPTLTFELYPLGIILFSNLLLYREKLTFTKAGWLALSILGVVFVSGGATDADSGGNWAPEFGPALAAAIIAVTMLALGMTLVSKSAAILKENKDAPIFASLVARFGGAIFTFPFLALGIGTGSINITWSKENLLFVLFYGIVILTISNFAYYKGIAIARTHMINVVWYVTPVLSIFWLTLLGFGTINEWVGIGSAFVIVANIMLHLSESRRHSFRFSVTWILVVGTTLALVPGVFVSSQYFEPIAALLVFFALLHGFALNRLDTCIAKERQLAVEIVRSDSINRLPTEQLKALRQAVAELPMIASDVGRDRLYTIIQEAKIRGSILQKIEEIVLSRAQRLAVGELFVMLTIGATIVLLAIATRPSGWVYSAFALIASIGVAFTLLTLIDRLSDRSEPIFELRDRSDREIRMVISSGLVSNEPLAERVLVSILAISLICVFLVIFYFFGST